MSNEELTLSIKTRQREDGSAYNAIQLGDWKVGRFVTGVHLEILGGERPKLIIECYPERIEVDGLEVEALLEKRLSEAKSLVEDLASTINSLEIKVNSKEEIREAEKSIKLRHFATPSTDF
ncbi:hypothetical protein CSX19_09655 [Listeria monocytogenes]|nr:hypothetical protein [Listeria monocytogenes]ECP0398642.1 hypothetical protein [Listeria monocytogenes]EGK2649193.1 hypothetical protein [Listeria monocytogenes]